LRKITRIFSFFGIQNVYPADSSTIHIRFSEPVFNLAGKPVKIKIGEKGITDISPRDPLFREFTVKLADPLKRTEIYQLEIPDGVF